jgi:hypothetical protein
MAWPHMPPEICLPLIYTQARKLNYIRKKGNRIQLPLSIHAVIMKTDTGYILGMTAA